MQMTDQRDIAAEPATVWTALLDPEVLKRCIPGCQEMQGNPDDGYEAVVTQKVGPVKATFKGAVTLSNVVEGRSCTISGEGKGGPAGFAKGGADVRLEPRDGHTCLSYDVEAKVGGKLAQLGSRIIDGFAKKMADQFFDDFKSVVESDNPREAIAGDAPEGATSQSVDPSGDAVAANTPPPAPNTSAPPGGGGAPVVKGQGDAADAPTAPDEPKEKKGWFKRLISD